MITFQDKLTSSHLFLVAHERKIVTMNCEIILWQSEYEMLDTKFVYKLESH